MTAEERPVWGTRKYRAMDLEVGDVARNAYGKWARIQEVHTNGLHTSIYFDTPGTQKHVRDVELIDVQVAKPS